MVAQSDIHTGPAGVCTKRTVLTQNNDTNTRQQPVIQMPQSLATREQIGLYTDSFTDDRFIDRSQ